MSAHGPQRPGGDAMSTYNGWSNYETWNVKLWLDNEQGSSEEMRDLARRARSESDLAKQIEAYVDEFKPDLGASLFSDLLNTALGEVNWDEIAASYYEEEHEDDEEESDEEAN